MKKSIYQEKGYEDRADYLRSLGEDYGVPSWVVKELAYLLGPIEDFDGLVSEIQDYADMHM